MQKKKYVGLIKILSEDLNSLQNFLNFTFNRTTSFPKANFVHTHPCPKK